MHGNAVGCVNTSMKFSRINTEISDGFQVYHLGNSPSHARQFRLAIPPCVGKMSTGDGYGSSVLGNNIKPVTRIVGILT